MWTAQHFLTLAAALALDRILGDPDWVWRRIPHPVAGIGRAIHMLEFRWNRAELPFPVRRRRGITAIALLVVCGGVFGVGLALALSRLPLGAAVEALIAAILFAQKSLLDHVRTVAERLRTEGLGGARAAVSLIVGRDVSALDEPGVARAAIESAAENFSDGLVAPAFWFALLGLPGLLVLKIVSTADSMIGHRSPRFEAFGWAAAKLDDLLCFLPARLSAALIAVAAILDGRPRSAVRTALRDSRLHKSPNAGWPEAAVAGALGLALGGPRRYGDLQVDGAWLNGGGRERAGPDDILRTLRLIDAAWALVLALTILAGFSLLWTAL